jgi:hypothetical protein
MIEDREKFASSVYLFLPLVYIVGTPIEYVPSKSDIDKYAETEHAHFSSFGWSLLFNHEHAGRP